MNNYDSIFSGVDNNAISAKKYSAKMSKEDYANVERQRREKLFSMADDVLVAIADIKSMFDRYLDVQGRFITYSPTNAALILAQKPHATFFRDWKWWRDEHGVDTRGKDGLYILESSSKSFVRDDLSTGRYINAKQVFDASDVGVSIGVREYDTHEVLHALYSASPVKFQRDLAGAVDVQKGAAYDATQNVILVNGDIPVEYMFGCMARESCITQLQQKLGDYFDSELHDDYAVCAAYMLCVYYGQDAGSLNIENIHVAERMTDPKAIKQELTLMRDAASEIERGIGVTFYRAETEQNKTDVEQSER